MMAPRRMRESSTLCPCKLVMAAEAARALSSGSGVAAMSCNVLASKTNPYFGYSTRTLAPLLHPAKRRVTVITREGLAPIKSTVRRWCAGGGTVDGHTSSVPESAGPERGAAGDGLAVAIMRCPP